MDSSLDALYDISLSTEDRERAWQENRQLSQQVLSEYELDEVEQCIVLATGLLAGIVDAFFVTDARLLSNSKGLTIRNAE